MHSEESEDLLLTQFHSFVQTEIPKNYKQNICCIGAGYVGGTTMAVFSKHCPNNNFYVVDINESLIDAWNSNTLPIFEPGLLDIVSATRGKNLFFTTKIEECIRNSYFIFISVNTPTKKLGLGSGKASNLQYLELAVRTIASVSTHPKIIVEKSTVPVQTCSSIRQILKTNSNVTFSVLSNPEFLAEGTAVEDLTNPNRVLIGGIEKEQESMNDLISLYQNWVPRNKIITTNIWSSELAKLVSNAFLAQRISSINSIAPLCEITKADINEISTVVGMDDRIGNKFLQPSVGFGGSCFQKDILSLIYICEYFNLNEPAEYWKQVITMNDYSKKRFSRKIVYSMFNNISGKKISVFGFSYKKNTGDTRESCAIYVTKDLIEEGALVSIFDPVVKPAQIDYELGQYKDHVMIENDPLQCIENSHAIVVLTEWNVFKEYDYEFVYSRMKKPAFIFDGRNLLDVEKLRKIGFTVYSIGKFYR